MDDKFRPCFQCGSQPYTVEYGSAIAIAGRYEQYGVIRCSGEKQTDCPVEIIISFDSDYPVGDRIDLMLKAAWDVLNSVSITNTPETENKTPRITEDDAREIAIAYAAYAASKLTDKTLPITFSGWLKDGGSELLDKLNGVK